MILYVLWAYLLYKSHVSKIIHVSNMVVLVRQSLRVSQAIDWITVHDTTICSSIVYKPRRLVKCQMSNTLNPEYRLPNVIPNDSERREHEEHDVTRLE